MRCVQPLMMTMVAGLLLAASGPAQAKKKKKDAEEATPVPAEVVVTPKSPGDKNSTAFAAALVKLAVTDISPLDAGSGARFLYQTMRFAPDNTWSAQGFVDLMGERMECQESGTWELEPASSPTEATMTWTVVETSCINQEPGPRRYLVTLEGGNIRTAYR